MSKSLEEHRNQFISLMEAFSEGTVDADTFVRRFLALRNEHLEDELARQTPDTRAAIEDLSSRHRNGLISEGEFLREWGELWHYNPGSQWLSIFDSLFTEIDAYATGNSREAGDLGEAVLRRHVSAHLSTLRDALSNS